MKYRSKLFEIEAVQFTGDNYEEILSFVEDESIVSLCFWPPVFSLYISAWEGNIEVFVGDYIIKGILGDFYPCSPKVFETKYEKMEESK